MGHVKEQTETADIIIPAPHGEEVCYGAERESGYGIRGRVRNLNVLLPCRRDICRRGTCSEESH